MAATKASKGTARKASSKTKAVAKTVKPPSSDRPRYKGRFVAATPLSANASSNLTGEASPTYPDRGRELKDQITETHGDRRHIQYRVPKLHARRRHRDHHISSESSSDSEEEDEPNIASLFTEAEIPGYRIPGIGGDPPQSWYCSVDMSRETARLLWWGLDTQTQKTYVTVAKSYGVHCAIRGVNACFPATVYSLAHLIADLDNKGVKIETIKAHLGRVRSLHVDMGYEGDDLAAFDSLAIKRIMAGIRRLRGV